jgi:hypothetical protein
VRERGHLEDRCRCKDNIKVDVKGIGYEVVDWIGLAQERDRRRAFVNTVVNLRVQMRTIS